jgi:hypothetical protein
MSIKINNFKKTHSINSWLNLVFSIAIVVLVFIAVVIKLLAAPTELVEEVGIKTFRMYTVLSNMLVAISVAMTIPFTIDGIRYKNYHLPRWIVNFIFISTTCITLTFIVSLTLLSAYAGFDVIMLEGTNLFLHTIVPIITIITFLFINIYHTVKFKVTWYALIPVGMYAIVYLISAIIIGQENGGWRDHYHFNEFIPWYIVFVIIFALVFGIANLLRTVHNRIHKRDKIATEEYYQNAPEYNLPTIEEAIKKLAQENKQYDKGGEIIVPRRIINFLNNKYQSNKPLSELCNIYIDEYIA